MDLDEAWRVYADRRATEDAAAVAEYRSPNYAHIMMQDPEAVEAHNLILASREPRMQHVAAQFAEMQRQREAREAIEEHG
jgi:hypothetical protein